MSTLNQVNGHSPENPSETEESFDWSEKLKIQQEKLNLYRKEEKNKPARFSLPSPLVSMIEMRGFHLCQ